MSTIAPLTNVALVAELAERLKERPAHLPGIGVVHGFSGFGKTFAATYAANRNRALYVEAGSSWTRAKLLDSLLLELGQPCQGTIADRMDRVIRALAETDRLLILDEFDHLVSRGLVELVREIHDKAGAAIILIGEELLPAKLARWERMHNRVLSWVAAQPAGMADVAHLAKLYAPGLEIAGDLLGRIHAASAGRVRRACVSIEMVRERAATLGLSAINLAAWGDAPLSVSAPRARKDA